MATTPTVVTVLAPNKVQYQTPLVLVNRRVTPEWLRWFNELQTAGVASAALAAQVAAIQTALDALETTVATLETQLAAVETDVAENTAAIATLENNVSKLTNLVNFHTTQINELFAEIEAIKTYQNVFATKRVSANYQVTYADYDVDVDATAGAITITLPAAANLVLGEFHVISKYDVTLNKVTIDGNGQHFETATGPTTFDLLLPGWSFDLQWNGAFWKIH